MSLRPILARPVENMRRVFTDVRFADLRHRREAMHFNIADLRSEVRVDPGDVLDRSLRDVAACGTTLFDGIQAGRGSAAEPQMTAEAAARSLAFAALERLAQALETAGPADGREHLGNW